jgi:hypothetical protein
MGLKGQVVAGSICNRMGYNLLMVVSALGSALAAYLVWGFAHTAGLIYLFAAVFGSVVSDDIYILPSSLHVFTS